MHRKTITLFDCKPFRAKITPAACKARHEKSKRVFRRYQMDWDYCGSAHEVLDCLRCKGLTGGETVEVVASPPVEKIYVPDTYGGLIRVN